MPQHSGVSYTGVLAGVMIFSFCSRTWSGPAWTAAQSLLSVLVSIQSLLNEKPYHNEPGYQLVGLKAIHEAEDRYMLNIVWCVYVGA